MTYDNSEIYELRWRQFWFYKRLVGGGGQPMSRGYATFEHLIKMSKTEEKLNNT